MENVGQLGIARLTEEELRFPPTNIAYPRHAPDYRVNALRKLAIAMSLAHHTQSPSGNSQDRICVHPYKHDRAPFLWRTPSPAHHCAGRTVHKFDNRSFIYPSLRSEDVRLSE